MSYPSASTSDTAPQTPFYVAGGTLSRQAPSYVTRQADTDLLNGLLAGQFCYVLTPRQMGKSSLMVRTAQHLRQQRVGVALLDLTSLGQNLTVEQWYGGLLERVGKHLNLEDALEEFWVAHERTAPLPRFLGALREVVLALVPGRVVIFVDEIDYVRSLPFSTDEFFAGIRECYNRRVEEGEYERLTFCLLGVATPADLITDPRTTPFNIGRRIELRDFTPEEAAPLASGLNLREGTREEQRRIPNTSIPQYPTPSAQRLLARALYWTGGHPYLTQRLCLAVAEAGGEARGIEVVDRCCEQLFLSNRAREADDNLALVRTRLLRSEVDVASLLDLYSKVWVGKRVADAEASALVSVLRLSGVVKAEGGYLRVRNRIYGRMFDRAWILESLPDAEVRRQREAYRRGMLRAAAFASIILLALGGLTAWALKNGKEAKDKTALATANERRANREIS